MTAGKTATDLNKQTIIINNTSPIYSSPGGQMHYNPQMGGSPGPYYGAGGVNVQMTSPYGSPQMQMNAGLDPNPMNTNQGGENAKISF